MITPLTNSDHNQKTDILNEDYFDPKFKFQANDRIKEGFQISNLKKDIETSISTISKLNLKNENEIIPLLKEKLNNIDLSDSFTKAKEKFSTLESIPDKPPCKIKYIYCNCDNNGIPSHVVIGVSIYDAQKMREAAKPFDGNDFSVTESNGKKGCVNFKFKLTDSTDKYRNDTSESMRSIFESQKTFENAFVDFKTIKTDFMLSRFLIKKLSPKKQKTGFIWQMQGNQLIPAIQDAIESFNDDTDYYIVRRDMSPQELASYTGSHLYTSKEEASDDETSGLIIIGEFTMMSPRMRNFILDIIKEKNGYYLGINWRLILTGNIHEGDEIWLPEFNDIFENVEWAPMPVSKIMYDDPDEEYESMKTDSTKPSISESMENTTGFMSVEEAKDKIYTILYNAAKKGEILPEEYIYIDEDGVIVDDESGFDTDMLRRARRADLFIDFDALEDGNVIIYTKPLYMFIEENIMG